MNQVIDRYFKGRILLFSIALHAVLFIIAYLLFTPYYQTNDDVGMMMYIRGIATLNNQPTEHVLFINIILSKFLTYLTTIFGKEFDVYTSFLLLVLFFSHCMLGFIYFEHFRKSYHLLLYVIFFMIFGFYSIISLQYTVVAAIVGFTGLLLIVYDKIPLGVAAVLLGGFIRVESAVMIIPFVIILLFFNMHILRNRLKEIIFFIGCFLSILFLINTYNDLYYEQEIVYINKFRRLADYEFLNKTTTYDKREVLNSLQWSENDYNMLMDFFFMEEEKYSMERLSKAISYYQEVYHISHLVSPGTYYHVNKYFFSRSWGLTFLIFSILILVLFYSKKNLILIFITTILLALLIAWINYFFKWPPERIIFPLFFSGAFLLLVMIPKSIVFSRYLRNFCFLLLLLLSFYHIWLLNDKANSVSQWREKHKAFIEQLKPNKQELYIIWGDAFKYEYIPLFNSLTYLDNMTIFSLGSLQRFSYAKNLLSAFGVQNIYIDIIDRSDIKLMCNERQMSMYQKYLLENYSIEVVVEKQQDFEGGFVYSIYKK